MRLVSAASVVETMGIASNAGSLANASQTLDLCYSVLENLLETSFAQQHVYDCFDTIGGELSYRTKNRFIDKDTLVVRRSTNSDPLLTVTDGDVVPPSEYSLDADKGVITFRQQQPWGRSILSAEYDSGLPVSDESDDMLTVPQWLASCAIATAIHILNTFPSSSANRKVGSIINVSLEIRHISSQLINPRMRPRMSVIFPAFSIVDE